MLSSLIHYLFELFIIVCPVIFNGVKRHIRPNPTEGGTDQDADQCFREQAALKDPIGDKDAGEDHNNDHQHADRRRL